MTRVLVAGLGDTGELCAGALARRGLSVVGVSPTTGLVSGQELGLRLTRPEAWSRDYRIPYRSFRRLDRVEVVHGRLVGADLPARRVEVEDAEGQRSWLGYDVLVVATGVANGFWRSSALREDGAVAADLEARHRQFADAARVGTTLYSAPWDLFEPRYGEGSRQAHLEAGAAEVTGPLTTLRRDVDDLPDLQVAAALGVGEHTRRVLDALGLF